MRDPGMKLRSSGFAASSFTHRAILLAHPFFSVIGSLTALGAHRLAKELRGHLSPPSSTEGKVWLSFMGTRHSDSGPHVCEADILLAEPSPQAPPSIASFCLSLAFQLSLTSEEEVNPGTYPVGPGLRSQALARSVRW